MGLASQSVKVWAEKDASKALEMFNQGASYETLRVHFGRSRGSIAGLINRFRGKKLVTRNIESIKIHKAKKQKHSDPIAIAIVQKAPIKGHRVRLRLITNETEVTFAELQHFHCRFPLGDPKLPDFRFCGKFKCDDSPYCKDHSAIAYTGLPQRRK